MAGMWNNIRRIEEALQKLRHNYKELTLVIYKQEKQIQFLETKALHLSMFYVASQLVIFVSSSKPSAYQCRNWWKPFLVSLSIAVVFGLNFAATLVRYVRTKYEQDRNFIDQEENYNQMARLERRHQAKNGSDGSPTSLEIDVSDEYVQRNQELRPDAFAVYQRYLHLGATAAALLAFTVVVLHTCRSSVCAGTL